jgi:Ca2+-binding RTX toxin-like protein
MTNLTVNTPVGFVSTNSSIDLRGSRPVLDFLNSTLGYIWAQIDYAASGAAVSLFTQPDGSSLTANFTTGTIELSGGKASGSIITYSKLRATVKGVAAEFIVEGSIIFDTSSGSTYGEYTKVQYSNPSSLTAFIGSIRESNNLFTGEITSIFERVNYSSNPYYLEQTTLLSGAGIGTNLRSSSPLLSTNSAVIGVTSNYIFNSGGLIESREYSGANRTLLSDASGNIFIGLMAGDDIIRVGGNGNGVVPSGFAGNDLFIGDSGNNSFYNKREEARGEYTGIGNDTIDGGSGTDTVWFGANKFVRNFEFGALSVRNASVVVNDRSATDNVGRDTLINIEVLTFADKVLSWSELVQLFLNATSTPSALGALAFLSSSNDTYYGTAGNDAIDGLAGNDQIFGQGGRDMVFGDLGNDTIDGGAGTDTAAYQGIRGNFMVNYILPGRFSVYDKSGTEGADVITNVERLRFGDTNVALDLGTSEAAGQAVLLIGAVLGAQAMLTKRPLIGAVIDLFDQGYTIQQLAGSLMRLPIWAGTLTPSNSSADIANYLLTRVHGRAPTASELSDAIRSLDSDVQGTFLANLALSSANIAQVDLIGLSKSGFDYPLAG